MIYRFTVAFDNSAQKKPVLHNYSSVKRQMNYLLILLYCIVDKFLGNNIEPSLLHNIFVL